MIRRGDFVQINGRLAVVVATGEELGESLADHSTVWFGTVEDEKPEVWTIPTEYLSHAPSPIVRH
jgi:hypothetical protein